MQVVAEVGVGNAGKNSAGSTLIRLRGGAHQMDAITIRASAAALSLDSIQMNTVVEGTIATVSGDGKN